MLNRSGFKKKPKALKSTSKKTISQVQTKLWAECKRIIRAKYGNTCYTCGKKGLEGSNWHTGHFLPKGSLSAYLKYDLRLLRPQCYNCNINLGGNGAEYYRLMVQREGQEYVDNIFKDRVITTKAMDHYINLLNSYSEIK